jgi:cobalamin-dependent methionine synthase I
LKRLLYATFNGGNIATSLAREKAAQAWCKETTSHKEMNAELAEAFAEILDEIWRQPWLGNATTGEMLEELKIRAEIHGYINYRTVDA